VNGMWKLCKADEKSDQAPSYTGSTAANGTDF